MPSSFYKKTEAATSIPLAQAVQKKSEKVSDLACSPLENTTLSYTALMLTVLCSEMCLGGVCTKGPPNHSIYH